jgi:hypothetical protein
METIWKIPLKDIDYQELELPVGSKALSCQVQHNQMKLWALVDTDLPLRKYSIWIYGTGHPVCLSPAKEFLSTVQLYEGVCIFHVFVQADFV